MTKKQPQCPKCHSDNVCIYPVNVPFDGVRGLRCLDCKHTLRFADDDLVISAVNEGKVCPSCAILGAMNQPLINGQCLMCDYGRTA